MIDMLMPADGYLVDRLTNTIICGYCNLPQNDHDCLITDAIEDGTLTWEDLLTDFPDYYADDTPILDESFVEAQSNVSSEEVWNGIYATRTEVERGYFFGSYRDLDPRTCTHASAWKHYNPRTNTYRSGQYPEPHFPKGFSLSQSYDQSYEGLDFEDPRLMSLEFNELQGFVSSKLIDYGITANYQFHFFNIYVGSYDKQLHVGLLSFTHNTSDETITVTCKKCPSRLTISLNASRSEQEDFILAVIRHGNNHGPDFITKRSDFTFIHSTICDTNHDHREPCNRNHAETKRADLLGNYEEALDFLIQHRKVCTSSDCRCTHYYHLLSAVDRKAA